MRTLILGGTNESRDLAELLVMDGHEVIASLAGRVRRPTRIAGEVRVGGFGDANGLAAWLMGNGIDRVVDATHPFAEQISTNAVVTCRSTGTPLLRISRLSWVSHPLANTWTWIASYDDASREAAGYKKVLLTVGKRSLDHYRNLPDAAARMVELPEEPLPGSWRPLLERDPFTIDSGEELLRGLGVDVLVTKDSDGSLIGAKLAAVADLRVRVIMVRHAPVPKDVPRVATPWEVLAWINEAPA